MTRFSSYHNKCIIEILVLYQYRLPIVCCFTYICQRRECRSWILLSNMLHKILHIRIVQCRLRKYTKLNVISNLWKLFFRQTHRYIISLELHVAFDVLCFLMSLLSYIHKSRNTTLCIHIYLSVYLRDQWTL